MGHTGRRNFGCTLALRRTPFYPVYRPHQHINTDPWMRTFRQMAVQLLAPRRKCTTLGCCMNGAIVQKLIQVLHREHDKCSLCCFLHCLHLHSCDPAYVKHFTCLSLSRSECASYGTWDCCDHDQVASMLVGKEATVRTGHVCRNRNVRTSS